MIHEHKDSRMSSTRKPEPDVDRFIESLPSPREIRDRIARNAHENSVLKRLLRVSEAAHADDRLDRATGQDHKVE
jgi:hypothetical protein